MASRIASLSENKSLRTVVGTAGVLVALVLFTEMTLRTVAPITFIFGAMMAHEAINERYGLPEGANWLAYGASIFVAGTYLAVANLAPLIGGLLALVGLWFVFDGATTIRYGASRTAHEYVSDLDDAGETMLRMQTLNVVHQTLKDAAGPRTAQELATDLDLTESRVERALGFLDSEGRIEQIGDRYRAEPSRWGRITPIVEFLGWLPRRVSRPFRRVVVNA
ncbi:hypothetical protein [Halobacterium salinarum]|uniref:hypothetical protein n=1 Tax=Halobacterium salinarum TaxID=2242 RepID=UPI00255255D8|nr:hypothetical protein [Halobacterium salinarum]MDL0122861.1 hypothetical protein [Halobacterium salinarum]